jgi:putative glutamine amidotransferase
MINTSKVADTSSHAVSGELVDRSSPPVIGISSETLPSAYLPGFIPDYHGQIKQYHEAVLRAGGAPVILPHIVPDQSNRQSLEAMYAVLDGVLLPGGYDISPRIYGGVEDLPTGDVPVEEQDAFEEWLAKRALEDGKPILGICRGMHMINAVLGGSLYQDLAKLGEANHAADPSDSLDHVAHNLQVRPGKLKTALGVDHIGANSRHHQAIHRLGHGLIVVATAEDGVIEAIEAEGEGWVVGVESHPESMATKVPEWNDLFSAFVSQAQSYAAAQ